MNIEQWEDIPEYEGIYQASTFGRIRSVDRIRACKNNHTFLCKGKILKPRQQNSGYDLVWLRKDRKTKAVCVHRMVALTFLANPNGYEQINHIDGNKTNNAVENLEWCSRSFNQKHTYRELGYKPHNCKKVICIETGEIYPSIKAAEAAVGLYRGSIEQVVTGHNKTAGGYQWKRI